MTRINRPTRIPSSLKTVLVDAAKERGVTLAEYLDSIATKEALEALLGEWDGARSAANAYINPRSATAFRVNAVAQRTGRRQWDVWFELHRRAVG